MMDKPSTHTPSLFVSVIIPVFNDSKRLRRCLNALEQQTYPKHLYEVIVIDNGSDEAETVEAVVADFEQAIATCESKPGAYAARNKGLSLAKGEVIAFTDADCIPASNWLEKGVDYLQKYPNCGLVAGKIELFFKEPNRATVVELYESVTAFRQKEMVEHRRAGATANVFTRRSIIDQVGPFNAEMKSNGDMEWGGRVAAAGYEPIYADDLRVAHPARHSFEELNKRVLRLAGGVYNLYIKPDDPAWKRHKTLARLLLDDVMISMHSIIRAIKDARLKGVDQKLKVSGMICYVRFMSAREKLRLSFGGSPNRG